MKSNHSSFKNLGSFNLFPSDECNFQIWWKYSSVSQTKVKSRKKQVLYSCHFTNESGNPLSYFELVSIKRKEEDVNIENHINEIDFIIFEDYIIVERSMTKSYEV